MSKSVPSTLAICLLAAATICAAIAPVSAQQPMVCDSCEKDEAVIKVHVPAGARLIIDGLATKSTGPVRQFVHRRMQPGARYRHRLRAELTVDGKTHEQTKTVVLQAQQMVEVKFDLGVEPAVPPGNGPPVTTLVVDVPEDAEVYLEEALTGQVGEQRKYETMRLEAGQKWDNYSVLVVVERDGKKFFKEQSITMAGGTTQRLQFVFDATWIEMPVAEPNGDEPPIEPLTHEDPVQAGLRWIVAQQQADGRWTLSGYDASIDQPDPSAPKKLEASDVAATALALLPMLAAGHTHLEGPYRDSVAGGLRWLLQQQAESGQLRANSSDKAAMYAHGVATTALSRALKLTGDEALQQPVEKAVAFIVSAQSPLGGWRYRAGEQGDLSVSGWQLMAMHAADEANINVPGFALDNGWRFLDRVQSLAGARYAYQEGDAPTPSMTAVGLRCRIWNDWPNDHAGLLRGADYLLQHHPADDEQPNMAYAYFATHVFHFIGEPRWSTWIEPLEEDLLARQQLQGGHIGSWPPVGQRAAEGGRLYITSMALMTLQVGRPPIALPREKPAEPSMPAEPPAPAQPEDAIPDPGVDGDPAPPEQPQPIEPPSTIEPPLPGSEEPPPLAPGLPDLPSVDEFSPLPEALPRAVPEAVN